MGRTINSVRMGANEVADRWLKAKRALKKEDQTYADLLARMAKRHSSEAFYALDDPLEAAVFSVLIEILKEQRRGEDECGSSTHLTTERSNCGQRQAKIK